MNITIQHNTSAHAYRLILGDTKRPDLVVECSDARGFTGSRLYLGACVPGRYYWQVPARELDRFLLGLS